MATYRSTLKRFNGSVWDVFYPRTNISQVDDLQSALDSKIASNLVYTRTQTDNLLSGKIDKRSGTVTNSGVTLDTAGLFPYAITSAASAIGLEYNILLNARRRGITVTQSGTGLLSEGQLDALFDGCMEPSYSVDGIDPNNPFVLLIEGLPGTHTQTGGMFGWTSRYWPVLRYKVEAYNSYGGAGWVTWIDQSTTSRTAKDLVIPIPSAAGGVGGGVFTKIKITIYEAGGSLGDNGFKRWGFSEIFFIHPEAMKVHQYLDVEWANRLRTARTIAGVSFDGSSNIAIPFANLSNKPTTLAGYGITDASPAGHTHSQYALGTDVANKIFLKSNTDNRNSNTTPNDYNGKLEIKGLKINSAIGISGEGTYSALLGLRGWTNSSGGNSHELAFTGNGRIYHRDGATTSWGNWRYLIESDDARLTDARTPLSHTHPMSDITNLIDTLNGKAPSSHNHDNRYYQQVSGKQNVVATSLALGEGAARTIGINSTFKVLHKNSSGEIEEITLTLPNTTNLYEPKFTKNTGFNKNFGTTAGTVAEGNHKHDSLYSPAGHTHDDRYVKTVDQRPVLLRFRSYNQNLTSTSSSIDLSTSLLAGMSLMIEVNSHSSYQYTPKIIQITLGGGSYNQLYNKATFTNYCAGTMEIYSFSVHYYQNQLTFSNIEKLVGTFNSSTKTIEWTTNSSAPLYVGRVWTV